MPHRGRLNVLANVLRKPYEMILAEFEGTLPARARRPGDGDVKYHLGYSRDHTTRGGQQGAPLAAAPTRATSRRSTRSSRAWCAPSRTTCGDTERARVVPVLMHGDAAFTARASSPRRSGSRELDGYRTGGTIHIIVNNQIGFTTPPEDYRFTPLSERRRQDHPGAGLPRERRRSRGRRAGGAARDRVPPAVQEGRHHRPRLLPPPRPQRARRPDASRSR